jgi:hypothetical protein
MFYVLVENDNVIQCIDYTPDENDGAWREAIEVKPDLIRNHQVYGEHYFDLSKTPVEIVWPVLARPVEDRKNQVTGMLESRSLEICQEEINKALFENRDVDNSIIQSARADRDANLALVSACVSHTDLDALGFD